MSWAGLQAKLIWTNRQIKAHMKRIGKLQNQKKELAALRRKANNRIKRIESALDKPKAEGVSPAGTRLVAEFEGWYPAPYNDPVGYATVGYGHLLGYRPVNKADKKGVWVKGQKTPGRLTQTEGLLLLEQDLKWAADAVRDAIAVPLNQNQRDALISFTFNVGAGALQTSTLRKKLNKGDYKGAAAEFDKWVYANGKKLPGLVRRRDAEQALFLKK